MGLPIASKSLMQLGTKSVLQTVVLSSERSSTPSRSHKLQEIEVEFRPQYIDSLCALSTLPGYLQCLLHGEVETEIQFLEICHFLIFTFHQQIHFWL